MLIFMVLCNTAGAHESSDVMSLWSTRELAEAEVLRLRQLATNRPSAVTTVYGGDFSVEEVTLDKQSDEFINW